MWIYFSTPFSDPDVFLIWFDLIRYKRGVLSKARKHLTATAFSHTNFFLKIAKRLTFMHVDGIYHRQASQLSVPRSPLFVKMSVSQYASSLTG